MDALAIKPGVMPVGYRWAVFKLPPSLPHHIDVLLAPNHLICGWVRTRKGSKVSEAVVAPEGVAKGDCLNLLTDGQFLGVYGQRVIAADMVLQHTKHHRT